ncbi:probable DNA double-strand break repair Rad50 ATPase isoform X4 [Stegodyphus dumicola]|uniref:probable DNA double-strand break repair Rad50 ATPase isoform X4 n=1 Tax=Stegodyphus dumicola TaxID=202533 RepID=UPI0015AD7FC6|nr:probable DNA double-strand break repair Rad50 ATPase isoform X4 [Stegodyphus dumicola]
MQNVYEARDVYRMEKMDPNGRLATTLLHQSAAFTERQGKVRYSRVGLENRTEHEDLSQKCEKRNELEELRLLNKDLMSQKRAWKKEKYEYQLNELALKRKLKSTEEREEKLLKMVEKYKEHISVIEKRHQRKYQELQSVKEKEHKEAVSDLQDVLCILKKKIIFNGKEISESESRSLTEFLYRLEKLTERKACLKNSATQTDTLFTGEEISSMQNRDVEEHDRNERKLTVSEAFDYFKKISQLLILYIILIYFCIFATT